MPPSATTSSSTSRGGHSWRALRGVITGTGRVVLVGAHAHRAMLMHLAALWLASRVGRSKLIFVLTKWDNDDLRTLAGMLKAGQLKPAIDATYELSEAREAFRTYAEGHVRGKLVLTI